MEIHNCNGVCSLPDSHAWANTYHVSNTNRPCHNIPTQNAAVSKSSKHKVPELFCRIVLLPPTPNSDVNVIRSTVIPPLCNRTLEELSQLIINYGSSLVPTVCLSKVMLCLSAVNMEIRVQ